MKDDNARMMIVILFSVACLIAIYTCITITKEEMSKIKKECLNAN